MGSRGYLTNIVTVDKERVHSPFCSTKLLAISVHKDFFIFDSVRYIKRTLSHLGQGTCCSAGVSINVQTLPVI